MINKLIWIALSLLVLSCSKKNECDNSDQGIIFDLFLDLTKENGERFLDTPNFEISEIRIFDQAANFELQDFEVVELNGLRLLKISPINQRDIVVDFKDERISSFQIEVVSTEVDENCVVNITNYNVTSNQELICNCIVNQIIPLIINL